MQLSVLAKGEETTTAFKKLFAKYLGMPERSDVRKLRNVVENLKRLPSMLGDKCDGSECSLMTWYGFY